jgi:hypothetical protein
MLRVNTWRVITMMKDIHSLWDRTIENLVGRSMRRMILPVIPKGSIILPRLEAFPNPAGTGFSYLLQKLIFRRHTHKKASRALR